MPTGGRSVNRPCQLGLPVPQTTWKKFEVPHLVMMKDPVSVGLTASIGAILILAVWKTRMLRWTAVVLVVALLFYGARA